MRSNNIYGFGYFYIFYSTFCIDHGLYYTIKFE
jgi:hypothetical protein